MIAFFSIYNIRLVFKTFSLISIENTAAFNHRDSATALFFIVSSSQHTTEVTKLNSIQNISFSFNYISP